MNQLLADAISKIDALVLIHPDLVSPYEVIGNPYFLTNLRQATQFMKDSRKNIFCFPRYENRFGDIPEELYSLWNLIPSSTYGTPSSPDLLASHVKYISKACNANPSILKIGGGGISGPICVRYFLESWCEKVMHPYSQKNPETQNVQNRFKLGIILPELTDVL